METCIANLVEPGEKIVVGNNGIWGSRVVDMAGRYGGEHLVFKAERTHACKAAWKLSFHVLRQLQTGFMYCLRSGRG